ncbi:MAG: nucleoside monophosphate kinase [Candidatus Omnitrophota bacterium]
MRVDKPGFAHAGVCVDGKNWQAAPIVDIQLEPVKQDGKIVYYEAVIPAPYDVFTLCLEDQWSGTDHIVERVDNELTAGILRDTGRAGDKVVKAPVELLVEQGLCVGANRELVTGVFREQSRKGRFEHRIFDDLELLLEKRVVTSGNMRLVFQLLAGELAPILNRQQQEQERQKAFVERLDEESETRDYYSAISAYVKTVITTPRNFELVFNLFNLAASAKSRERRREEYNLLEELAKKDGLLKNDRDLEELTAFFRGRKTGPITKAIGLLSSRLVSYLFLLVVDPGITNLEEFFSAVQEYLAAEDVCRQALTRPGVLLNNNQQAVDKLLTTIGKYGTDKMSILRALNQLTGLVNLVLKNGLTDAFRENNLWGLLAGHFSDCSFDVSAGYVRSSNLSSLEIFSPLADLIEAVAGSECTVLQKKMLTAGLARGVLESAGLGAADSLRAFRVLIYKGLLQGRNVEKMYGALQEVILPLKRYNEARGACGVNILECCRLFRGLSVDVLEKEEDFAELMTMLGYLTELELRGCPGWETMETWPRQVRFIREDMQEVNAILALFVHSEDAKDFILIKEELLDWSVDGDPELVKLLVADAYEGEKLGLIDRDQRRFELDVSLSRLMLLETVVQRIGKKEITSILLDKDFLKTLARIKRGTSLLNDAVGNAYEYLAMVVSKMDEEHLEPVLLNRDFLTAVFQRIKREKKSRFKSYSEWACEDIISISREITGKGFPGFPVDSLTEIVCGLDAPQDVMTFLEDIDKFFREEKNLAPFNAAAKFGQFLSEWWFRCVCGKMDLSRVTIEPVAEPNGYGGYGVRPPHLTLNRFVENKCQLWRSDPAVSTETTVSVETASSPLANAEWVKDEMVSRIFKDAGFFENRLAKEALEVLFDKGACEKDSDVKFITKCFTEIRRSGFCSGWLLKKILTVLKDEKVNAANFRPYILCPKLWDKEKIRPLFLNWIEKDRPILVSTNAGGEVRAGVSSEESGSDLKWGCSLIIPLEWTEEKYQALIYPPYDIFRFKSYSFFTASDYVMRVPDEIAEILKGLDLLEEECRDIVEFYLARIDIEEYLSKHKLCYQSLLEAELLADNTPEGINSLLWHVFFKLGGYQSCAVMKQLKELIDVVKDSALASIFRKHGLIELLIKEGKNKDAMFDFDQFLKEFTNLVQACLKSRRPERENVFHPDVVKMLLSFYYLGELKELSGAVNTVLNKQLNPNITGPAALLLSLAVQEGPQGVMSAILERLIGNKILRMDNFARRLEEIRSFVRRRNDFARTYYNGYFLLNELSKKTLTDERAWQEFQPVLVRLRSIEDKAFFDFLCEALQKISEIKPFQPDEKDQIIFFIDQINQSKSCNEKKEYKYIIEDFVSYVIGSLGETALDIELLGLILSTVKNTDEFRRALDELKKVVDAFQNGQEVTPFNAAAKSRQLIAEWWFRRVCGRMDLSRVAIELVTEPENPPAGEKGPRCPAMMSGYISSPITLPSRDDLFKLAKQERTQVLDPQDGYGVRPPHLILNRFIENKCQMWRSDPQGIFAASSPLANNDRVSYPIQKYNYRRVVVFVIDVGVDARFVGGPVIGAPDLSRILYRELLKEGYKIPAYLAKLPGHASLGAKIIRGLCPSCEIRSICVSCATLEGLRKYLRRIEDDDHDSDTVETEVIKTVTGAYRGIDDYRLFLALKEALAFKYEHPNVPVIINLSFGGKDDFPGEIHQLISELDNLGVVIIAGAGNNNRSEPVYPAAYDEVIAVAGINRAETHKAARSNYNRYIACAAPSHAVADYGSWEIDAQGTSFACNFVAGLAAELLSRKRDLSERQAMRIILETTQPLENDRYYQAGLLGRGRVDCAAAFNKLRSSSPIIVLFGPPGAGKSSLAGLLSWTYHLPVISSGDILRQEIHKGSPLGREAEMYINKGSLVPEEKITEIVINELKQLDTSDGFILDGFPRTVNQARSLDNALRGLNKAVDLAVFLDTPVQVIVNRLSGRRVCPDCAENFHLLHKPPKQTGICDFCGGALFTRDDDKEETVRKRINIYHQETEPLIDYYTDKGKLRKFPGDYDSFHLAARVSDLLAKEKLIKWKQPLTASSVVMFGERNFAEQKEAVIRMARQWDNGAVLEGWRGRLQQAKDAGQKGAISLAGLADAERSIITELLGRLNAEFSYESNRFDLEEAIPGKKANCLGYTQLCYILSEYIGLLPVRPVAVTKDRVGYVIDLLRGESHSACLFNLSDGHKVLADASCRPFIISEPFVLENEYNRGTYRWEQKKDSRYVLYRQIRLCDENGLIADLYNSNGVRWIEQGNTDMAESCYEESIRRDPRNELPYINLSYLYERRGWEKDSEDILLAGIAANPDALLLYHRLTELYEHLGREDLAEQWYLTTLELDSTDIKACLNLSKLYIKTGKRGLATVYDEMLQELFELFSYRQSRCSSALTGQDTREICSLAGRAAHHYRAPPAETLRKILVFGRKIAAKLWYYKRKLLVGLLAVLMTANVLLGAGDAYAFDNRGIGESSLRGWDYTESVKRTEELRKKTAAIKAAIKEEKEEMDARDESMPSPSPEVKQRAQEAVVEYTERIKNEGGGLYTWWARGNAYNRLGEYQRAIDDYTRAIEIEPGWFELYNRRAGLYMKLGRYQEAAADWSDALGALGFGADYQKKQGGLIYQKRGSAYLALGQWEQALKDLQAGVMDYPQLAQTHHNLGMGYAAMEWNKEALSEYNKAVELDGKFALAYNGRGEIYARLGEYNQAVSNYTKAIELASQYTQAYANRAEAYVNLAQYYNAAYDYCEAIGFNSNEPGIRDYYFNRLKTTCSLLGQSSEDELIEVIKGKYTSVFRGAAMEALGELNNLARINMLIDLYNNEPVEIKRYAARALSNIDHPHISKVFLSIKDSSDEQLHRIAVQGLADRAADNRQLAAPLIQIARDDKDVLARQSAIEGLGRIVDPEIESCLVRNLRDEDWRIRRAGILALQGYNSAQLTPALLPLTKDENPFVRQAAVLTLENRVNDNAEVFSAVESAVRKDADENVRGTAVTVLSRVDKPEAKKALFDSLHDQSWVVRRQAVASLSPRADEQTIGYVVPLMDDKQIEVRQTAILSLSERARDFPFLAQSIIEKLRETSEDIRRTTLLALNNFADDQQIVALSRPFLNDEHWQTRVTALENLAPRVKDYPELAAPLSGIMDNDPYPAVRREAMFSLGAVEQPSITASVQKNLTSDDWSLRQSAAWALRNSQSEWVTNALKGALSDSHPLVRSTAVWALAGRMEQNPQITDSLTPLLRDQYWQVRLSAAGALSDKLAANDQLTQPFTQLAREERHPLVRSTAIFALGASKQPEAVEAIKSNLTADNWSLRQSAVEALSRMNSPAALASLNSALDDKHYLVRSAAIIGLADKTISFAQPPQTINTVKHNIELCLQDEYWQVRASAVSSLSRFTGPDIDQALKPALNDPSPVVRRSALYTLGSRLDKNPDLVPAYVETLKTNDDKILRQISALSLQTLPAAQTTEVAPLIQQYWPMKNVDEIMIVPGISGPGYMVPVGGRSLGEDWSKDTLLRKVLEKTGVKITELRWSGKYGDISTAKQQFETQLNTMFNRSNKVGVIMYSGGNWVGDQLFATTSPLIKSAFSEHRMPLVSMGAPPSWAGFKDFSTLFPNPTRSDWVNIYSDKDILISSSSRWVSPDRFEYNVSNAGHTDFYNNPIVVSEIFHRKFPEVSIPQLPRMLSERNISGWMPLPTHGDWLCRYDFTRVAPPDYYLRDSDRYARDWVYRGGWNQFPRYDPPKIYDPPRIEMPRQPQINVPNLPSPQQYQNDWVNRGGWNSVPQAPPVYTPPPVPRRW